MKSTCPRCENEFQQTLNETNGNLGWCPKCGHVFHRPIPEVPRWVYGVVAFLAVRVVLI